MCVIAFLFGLNQRRRTWAPYMPFIPREDTVLAHADERFLFTSESVTEGHPDKVADQISDAVLDAILADDPYGRVAVETFAITGQIHIAGEVTTKTYIDIPKIVRATIADIGYTRSKVGFDADTCGVSVSIDEQAPDIADGR